MYKKSEALLVYEKHTERESGSPAVSQLTKSVLVDDMGPWSTRYYEDGQRDMSRSNNLRVPDHHTAEHEAHTLKYVEYKGVRYSVKNILVDRNCRRYHILDIEAVR